MGLRLIIFLLSGPRTTFSGLKERFFFYMSRWHGKNRNEAGQTIGGARTRCPHQRPCRSTARFFKENWDRRRPEGA